MSNINTTVQTGEGQEMSPQMKTFYDKIVIKNAVPNLVHDQFGQKKPIPQGSGKTIEFRRLNPFPKATTPLTEGVTPDGKNLDWEKVSATVEQYGDYVTTTDMLDMTAIDSNIAEAGRVLGDQAGLSLDSVVKEILNGGTNVQYGEGAKTSRSQLTTDDVLTVKAVKRAVTTLKRFNAKRIDGDYVAIIHPDVAYDLMNDPKWEALNSYNPKNVYAGEIGRLYGVRFVETSEAKIFEKAGANSIDVYSTLFLGADAYGTTSIEGGGLEMIIKPKGSAGTADPLNQRSSVGWKATKTACILTDAFMVRVETASQYEA
ncbi:MAG: N4-gp56 family major capsid protein [Oscillospiraceae bacterium]|nr:N4-gp56 family major capsid protein [Oscillospiraceae bacterium]